MVKAEFRMQGIGDNQHHGCTTVRLWMPHVGNVIKKACSLSIMWETLYQLYATI